MYLKEYFSYTYCVKMAAHVMESRIKAQQLLCAALWKIQEGTNY